jgi:hypothetical protein
VNAKKFGDDIMLQSVVNRNPDIHRIEKTRKQYPNFLVTKNSNSWE